MAAPRPPPPPRVLWAFNASPLGGQPGRWLCETGYVYQRFHLRLR